MADEYIRRDTALRAVTKRYGACRSPAQNRLLDEIRNEIRRVHLPTLRRWCMGTGVTMGLQALC